VQPVLRAAQQFVNQLPSVLNVRAVVRSKDARSEALEKLGAEVVVGDFFEINTIREAMRGMEAAYLCYPVAPGLIHATINFAQAARETGIKTVLNISQRSANRESASDSCRDTSIAQEILNWSGLSVIHLRPTMFLEWLLYPWQLPYVQQGILRMPVGKVRHSPITADDQGRAIAALLRNPEGHIGTTIPLSGPVEMDPQADGR
jgi:NAD(P)H dehydrogenase (quinone)